MTHQSFCARSGVLVCGVALLIVVLAMPLTTTASPVAKRDIGGLLDGKDKRPFCNAFTGCGKKRSDTSVDALASGTELDDLAKHVLAEAKLWEQLQNKMEIMRTMAARMEDRPLYRRKRSLGDASEPKITSSSHQQIENQ